MIKQLARQRDENQGIMVTQSLIGNPLPNSKMLDNTVIIHKHLVHGYHIIDHNEQHWSTLIHTHAR